MTDRPNPDRRVPEAARESDETKRNPPNRRSRNEQGICVDERGQDQPEDKERAQKNR